MVPSLLQLSFGVLLANVSTLSGDAISSLPEHVQLGLFDGVLARGMLNEALLDVFVEAARCSSAPSTLEQRIRQGLALFTTFFRVFCSQKHGSIDHCQLRRRLLLKLYCNHSNSQFLLTTLRSGA